MNSHILIPKSVYKRFANEEKFYYLYDVKNCEIKKGHPKTTYTEQNYYSDYMEKIINKYIEIPLKKLLNFADKIDLDAEEIVFEEELKDIAKSYIISLTGRNPKMCELVCSNSSFAEIFSKQRQHDLTVALTMENQEYYKSFEKFNVSFIINATTTPFVLPTRGIYEYSINNVVCCSVPLTPIFSLLLKENKKQIHYEDDDMFLIIYDDDIINKLNTYAVKKQLDDKIGYIVSSNKEILESIKCSINYENNK